MDDKSLPTINDTENTDSKQQSYLGQLSAKEKIAFETAKVVLGSSFNIKKSIGYIEQEKLSK